MTVCIRQIGWTRPFFISSDDERITDFFVYSHNGSICDDQSIDGIHIKVSSHGAYYIVRCNGKTITTDSPIQTIVNLIFDETVYRADVFPLHGGAIEKSGKAYIFLASTQVGKTTLITYLTQSGYPYINDDHILIDMDTLSVVPDITPIHLRPESLPILERYGIFITGSEIKTEKIHRIIFSPERTASTDLPIGNIFFIDRSENINDCVPIEKQKAIELLMAGMISPKAADGNRLRCAIRLASRCKRLIYSDMRYVADLLRKGGGD